MSSIVVTVDPLDIGQRVCRALPRSRVDSRSPRRTVPAHAVWAQPRVRPSERPGRAAVAAGRLRCRGWPATVMTGSHELVQRRAPRRVETRHRDWCCSAPPAGRPRGRRAAGSPMRSSSATSPTSIDCGEGVHTQLHRAGLVATRRFGAPASGRWSRRSSSPTSTPTTSWISSTSSRAAGRTRAIDVYGPGPAGPPFTTPTIRCTRCASRRIRRRGSSACSTTSAALRDEHQRPHHRRGAQRLHRSARRARDRFEGRARRPTSTRRGSDRDRPHGRAVRDAGGRAVRRASAGRARRDGDRHARAARAGVPGARVPVRHAARFGGVLRRHRPVRQRRAAGRTAPTSSCTR